MQKLKKIFAIFSLVIFIFQFAEIGVHRYIHGNDFHCTATSHHFHTAEHHCSLCDFTYGFFSPPSFNDYHLELNKVAVLHFFFLENKYLIQNRDFLPLRAPPSLV